MPRPPSSPEKSDDMSGGERCIESNAMIFRRCRQPDQCSCKEVVAERPPASDREDREQRQRSHEGHWRVRRQEVGVAHVKEIDRKESRREESFCHSKRE